MSPEANAHLVCSACAPKPGRYDNLEPNFFVGRLVKKAFKGEDRDGQIKTEHMWVRVYGVRGEDLLGTLDNNPFLIVPSVLSRGDDVRFTVHDVEDVLGLEN